MRRLALTLAAVVAPGPAGAHLVGVEFGDAYAGALHYATGVPHLAGLVGLAALAAVAGAGAVRIAALALPPALALGVFLAVWPLAPWGGEVALGGLAVLVGGLAAVGLAWPGALVGGVAVLVGLVQGHANGLALADTGVDPGLFAAGVAGAGLVLATPVLALAAAPGVARAPILRPLAAVVAVFGLLLVARAAPSF